MNHPARDGRRGAIAGLASAALFGISAPVSKLLLPFVDPWVLAGLLYVGAGIGLVLFRLVQTAAGVVVRREEQRFQRADAFMLLAIAYFATAPFAGAIAAVPLLGEGIALNELAGGIIMAVGVALLMSARQKLDKRP